jgi:tetratricopeptide (TPR) repeat protein
MKPQRANERLAHKNLLPGDNLVLLKARRFAILAAAITLAAFTISSHLPLFKKAAAGTAFSAALLALSARVIDYLIHKKEATQRTARLNTVAKGMNVAAGLLTVIAGLLTLFKVPEEAYQELKRANRLTERNLSERLERTASLITKTETDPFKLAQGEMGTSDYNAAIRQLDDVINDTAPITNKRAEAFFYKGKSLFELHKYPAALLAANESIQLNPASSGAWDLKCFALQKLEQYTESLNACNKAISLNEKNA